MWTQAKIGIRLRFGSRRMPTESRAGALEPTGKPRMWKWPTHHCTRCSGSGYPEAGFPLLESSLLTVISLMSYRFLSSLAGQLTHPGLVVFQGTEHRVQIRTHAPRQRRPQRQHGPHSSCSHLRNQSQRRLRGTASSRTRPGREMSGHVLFGRLGLGRALGRLAASGLARTFRMLLPLGFSSSIGAIIHASRPV